MTQRPVTGTGSARAGGRARLPFALLLVVVVLGGGLLALVIGSQLRLVSGPIGTSVGGRIAVIESGGALVTMDPQGAATHRFALSDGAFSFPAYDPSGQRLAVIGMSSAGRGVYVIDDAQPADAAGAAPIPEPTFSDPDLAPIYASWSPDGRNLGILASGPEGLGLHVRAVADGGAARAPLWSGEPLFWDWLDASSLLVHSGGLGALPFLGEVPIAGAAPTPLDRRQGRYQAPVVSHDGRYRAYAIVADTDPAGSIEIVTAETDIPDREVPIESSTALGWSPVEDLLGYIAGRPQFAFPVGPLHVVDPTGGDPRTVLDGDVVAFAWSPDGHSIATIAVASDEERASLGGGAVIKVSFVDPASGIVSADSVLRPGLTFVNEILPYFDQYALSHQLWSPASDAIVLPVIDTVDGPANIAVIDAATGQQRRIAPGQVAFWGP